MPLLKDKLLSTDTTIQNTVQDITNILSINEIINLNILNLISENFTVPSGSLFIASSSISSPNLHKFGGGTLHLSGINTFASSIIIYEGTLLINNANNIGGSWAGYQLLPGATLRIESNSLNPIKLPADTGHTIVIGTSSNLSDCVCDGPYYSNGNLIIEKDQKFIVPEFINSPNINLNGVLEINSTNNSIIASIINGSGKIIINANVSTVTLASVNTYSGGTDVFTGAVQAGTTACFGFGPIRLYSGATLDLNNQAINNTIYTEGGTILNDSNYTGQIYYI